MRHTWQRTRCAIDQNHMLQVSAGRQVRLHAFEIPNSRQQYSDIAVFENERELVAFDLRIDNQKDTPCLHGGEDAFYGLN